MFYKPFFVLQGEEVWRDFRKPATAFTRRDGSVDGGSGDGLYQEPQGMGGIQGNMIYVYTRESIRFK